MLTHASVRVRRWESEGELSPKRPRVDAENESSAASEEEESSSSSNTEDESSSSSSDTGDESSTSDTNSEDLTATHCQGIRGRGQGRRGRGRGRGSQGRGRGSRGRGWGSTDSCKYRLYKESSDFCTAWWTTNLWEIWGNWKLFVPGNTSRRSGIVWKQIE